MELGDAISSPSSHVIVIIINGTQSNKPLSPYSRFLSYNVDALPDKLLNWNNFKSYKMYFKMKPGKNALHHFTFLVHFEEDSHLASGVAKAQV